MFFFLFKLPSVIMFICEKASLLALLVYFYTDLCSLQDPLSFGLLMQ